VENDLHEELASIWAGRMKIEERQQPDKWDKDLQAIQGERMRLDDLERKIIWRLRVDDGESWSDIGRRLGVSKQAAWERFGKPFPAQGRLAPGPDRDD
jgi:DNA-directed RNA polymerase specialized sigma subunit